MSKITKQEFNLIFSDDCTIKQQKEILSKIATRVNCVIHGIGKVSWWDFMGGGDGREGDFFESYDGEYLALDGKYSLPEPYKSVYNWFPIHWLWDDYELEVQSEIEKYKKENEDKQNKSKAAREALKIKKAEVRKLIEGKLTKDELKFIKFK